MVTAVKEITIAHSPDSDDAFMFYGLASEQVETFGIKVHQVLKDIQSLNQDAKTGKYEVSAISFAAYPEVSDRYALMPCGASMGNNYGPMVVAREQMPLENLKKVKIAIPGKLTTAYLALRLLEQELDVVEYPFDEILEAVRDGKVDAGLIIHEGQLTYAEMGLKKIVDLGQWWYEKYSLPLPLGGNVVRKDLGIELMKKATKMLQDSIKYSLTNRKAALDYAMSYARGLETNQADKFVGMYVNELTVDYGDAGRKAVELLFQLAFEKGIIANKVNLEFITLD
ncbi:MAG: hypothetical protein K2W82_07330 [Candidatus Obscuribacterales bacterium]|nr:hypothetical protein [Candidatus Obscuribacterales bacterium]